MHLLLLCLNDLIKHLPVLTFLLTRFVVLFRLIDFVNVNDWLVHASDQLNDCNLVRSIIFNYIIKMLNFIPVHELFRLDGNLVCSKQSQWRHIAESE